MRAFNARKQIQVVAAMQPGPKRNRAAKFLIARLRVCVAEATEIKWLALEQSFQQDIAAVEALLKR